MKKAIISLVLAAVMLFTMTAAVAETAPEYPDIEIWSNNNGYLAVEIGGPSYTYFKELTGVGMYQPYVEWNGGTTYQEQLNLRIAANEMPDLFIPVNGMETELIKAGAILDLTDLLPEKAPHLYEAIPEAVWDIVRANDPTGEGRIYYVPSVLTFARSGGIIRQDWLDNLNMSMPTTQEEFVEVLRAFKTKDPNGNGEADEIPTGGRAEARWMDYLFSMYGVASWEGYPQWDLYDGELTYSAVTPNMKAALEWIASLYAEGLLDPETLLNDKAAWDGKINSGRVGVYHHWAQASYEYAENIEASTGVKAKLVLMPPISAEGFEGFYTALQIGSPQWVAAYTTDEKKIDAVMRALDCYGNSEMRQQFVLGVPGMHCEYDENGVGHRLPLDMQHMENYIFHPDETLATVESTKEALMLIRSEDTAWAVDQSIENLENMAGYGKAIAGDGIPNSIYTDYQDIQNRTLYAQYASKIITGEYPIEKFDEFVEKWYASGGQTVTERAREWYAKMK